MRSCLLLALVGVGLGFTCIPVSQAAQPAFEQIDRFKKPLEPCGEMLDRGDGYSYGVARGTGPKQGAVIFRVAPHHPPETLHQFSYVASSDDINYGGDGPACGLVVGADGAFYGCTKQGGAHAFGTIYRITHEGDFRVLYNRKESDGLGVNCLISAPDGYLYGSAAWGGANDTGTLFRVSLAGDHERLYDFPVAALVSPRPPTAPTGIAFGADGFLYGITGGGGQVQAFGSLRLSFGNFFRYEGSGQITVLSDFFDGKEVPWHILNTSDGFYVTTDDHLLHLNFAGTKTLLADFAAAGKGDDVTPCSMVDTADGLYGITLYQGANGSGFAYRYVPGAGIQYLHEFSADYRGRPRVLVRGSDGMVYGIAGNFDLGGKGSRFFRFRDATQFLPNFRAVAGFDRVILPAKATDGSRKVLIDYLANDWDPERDPVNLTTLPAAPAGTLSFVESKRRAMFAFTTTEADPASCRFTYGVSDPSHAMSTTGSVSVLSPATGRYAGEASSPTATTGQLMVVVGKNNSFTATFTLNGLRYTGKGAFDADDSAQAPLKAKGGNLATLDLHVERGASRQLAATILVGETLFTATCTQAAN